MRIVEWKENGYICRALVRDEDKDSDAPTRGIRILDPFLMDMDLEGFRMDLHNLLAKEGISSYNDLMRNTVLVKHLLWLAARPRLIELFKSK